MQAVRNYFGYWLLDDYINHACISHVICICTHVAAAAEEVVYEVVAEPQEPLEQAQQEARREAPAQGPVHPSTEQQPGGKPRCIIFISNYARLYIFITCII